MAREMLSMKDRFALNKLVTEQYTKSGMTNTEFAEYAKLELKLEVKSHHIKYILEELDIPTNEQQRPASLAAQVAALAARVEFLEKKLEDHLRIGDRPKLIGGAP